MPRELRITPDEAAVRPTLRISYDADADLLFGLVPGVVIDGHPEEDIAEVLNGLWLFRRDADGPIVGFCVDDAFGWDVLGNEDEDAVWDADDLRFDVPTLGLKHASIGDIVLAAQQTLEGSTPDVALFDLAVGSSC